MPEVEINRVEVVRWVEETDPAALQLDDGSADHMQPASPRHARPRPGLWRRTVAAGQEALASASEAIAAEVDMVAERMMAALEQRHADRRAHRVQLGLPDPGWEVEEIEVSFGVQLTGQATVTMFSGSAEASAQIMLRFARAAPPAAGVGHLPPQGQS